MNEMSYLQVGDDQIPNMVLKEQSQTPTSGGK